MPAFDLKALASLVTPPKHPLLDGSVFDPGSPQYVRPEDMMLDIQASIFGFKRKEKAAGVADPADFEKRWKNDGASKSKVERVGDVSPDELGTATMALVRTSRRKGEHFPAVLPLVPAISAYKNVSAKLPTYFKDQVRPLVTFGGPETYKPTMEAMCEALRARSQADDSLLQIADALVPLPNEFSALSPAPGVLTPYDNPVLMDFSSGAGKVIPICQTYRDAVSTIVEFERVLPHVLWIRWFTALNRLFLPLFFLRRCTAASFAARAMRRAIRDGSVYPTTQFSREVSRAPVLRGSPDMLNQLQPVVQDYVRGRIELAVALQLTCLAEELKDGLDPGNPTNHPRIRERCENYYMDAGAPPSGSLLHRRLAMPGDKSAERYPLDEWLGWLGQNRRKLDNLAKFIAGTDASDLIDKAFAELRRDYMPLTNGFGKNAKEFVAFMLGAPSKVDRDAAMPDEFNLIQRSERGTRSGHIAVRPGQQLLVMLVQLVARRAELTHNTSAKLGDICDLFEAIGVDFRSEPSDFDFLKGELLRHGLLETSADAAEAASLKPAYALRLGPLAK